MGLLGGRFCSSLFCEQPLSLKIAQAGFLGSLSGILASRHFSQELACSDVARALVPAGVPPGPGTLADASFDTVSQPYTRIEMPGTGPQTGSLDTAGRVPAPHRLAECEKVGLGCPLRSHSWLPRRRPLHGLQQARW